MAYTIRNPEVIIETSHPPMLQPEHYEQYDRDGYVLIRNALDRKPMFDLLEEITTLAGLPLRGWVSKQPLDATGHSFAEEIVLPANQLARGILYRAFRNSHSVRALASPLASTVRALLDSRDLTLTEHCRLRMDLPRDTEHLAIWHQDHAYVGGSTRTITAYIPLQDTPWDIGPLLVMPGSHKLGAFPHDRTIGTRKTPSILPADREIRMVEMKRGDVLFFSALLLHSGQTNLSDRVRFSVQARFAPID